MVDVIKKLSIVINSKADISNSFYNKWGIHGKDIITKLNDKGLHGGLYSKVKSIKNALKHKQHGSKVLNIGPETGVELFLLLELGLEIDVCEPDIENLRLLKLISKNYITEDGKIAYKNMNFLNVGFRMNKKKLASEQRNYLSIHQMNKTGLPTFYKISPKIEPISSLNKKYDIIFIHKVLTSLSRFCDETPTEIFIKSIKELIPKISSDGLISWTEPMQLIDSNYQFDNLVSVAKLINYTIPDIKEKYIQILIYK